MKKFLQRYFNECENILSDEMMVLLKIKDYVCDIEMVKEFIEHFGGGLYHIHFKYLLKKDEKKN